MFSQVSDVVLLGSFLALSLLALVRGRIGLSTPVTIYLPYLWTFFLVFALAEFVSFQVGIWVLAVLCFLALREYFSLVDLRIQDRWAILAAYAAIPFMYFYIHTGWYGMFIISVPVYAFLVIPFAVAMGGGKPQGSVLSVGVIDLGLFLLVYCIGHVGYLTLYSTWIAVYLVMGVVLCDLFTLILDARNRPPVESVLKQVLVPLPAVALLGLALGPWTGIPWLHSLSLGLVIPVLVTVGCFTIDHLEVDLGIDRSRLAPGRGEILNTLKSFLYVAPVVFHY
ncbi:phosphatidate cytidylyltransferase, partial [Gemmatimonadota bacterium]